MPRQTYGLLGIATRASIRRAWIRGGMSVASCLRRGPREQIEVASRVRLVGIYLQRAQKMRTRFRNLSLRGQRDAEIAVRLGVVRVQLQRPLACMRRLVDLVLRPERHAKK